MPCCETDWCAYRPARSTGWLRVLLRGAAIFAGAAFASRGSAGALAAVTFGFALLESVFDFLDCVGRDFFLTHDVSRMFSQCHRRIPAAL